MKLSFYGGVREIGGNKVLLEAGTRQIDREIYKFKPRSIIDRCVCASRSMIDGD